jgi:hypothetical protein
MRAAGDLVQDFASWRAWGGLLNAAALLLFIVINAIAVIVGAVKRV